MRFEQRLRDGLHDGSITVAFRRWKRHQVVAGGRYRKALGLTLSQPAGYRLSPRGQAYLDRTAHGGGNAIRQCG